MVLARRFLLCLLSLCSGAMGQTRPKMLWKIPAMEDLRKIIVSSDGTFGVKFDWQDIKVISLDTFVTTSRIQTAGSHFISGDILPGDSIVLGLVQLSYGSWKQTHKRGTDSLSSVGRDTIRINNPRFGGFHVQDTGIFTPGLLALARINIRSHEFVIDSSWLVESWGDTKLSEHGALLIQHEDDHFLRIIDLTKHVTIDSVGEPIRIGPQGYEIYDRTAGPFAQLEKLLVSPRFILYGSEDRMKLWDRARKRSVSIPPSRHWRGYIGGQFDDRTNAFVLSTGDSLKYLNPETGQFDSTISVPQHNTFALTPNGRFAIINGVVSRGSMPRRDWPDGRTDRAFDTLSIVDTSLRLAVPKGSKIQLVNPIQSSFVVGTYLPYAEVNYKTLEVRMLGPGIHGISLVGLSGDKLAVTTQENSRVVFQESKELYRSPSTPSWVTALAPNGVLLAMTDGKNLVVYNLENNLTSKINGIIPYALHFVTDSELVAFVPSQTYGDRSKPPASKLLSFRLSHNLVESIPSINWTFDSLPDYFRIHVSPDEQRVYFLDSKNIGWIERESRLPHQLIDSLNSQMRSFIVSRNEHWIFTFDCFGTVNQYLREKRKRKFRIPRATMFTLTPNERYLIIPHDSSFARIDLMTGEWMGDLEMGQGRIKEIKFNSNGKTFTMTTDVGSISLWETPDEWLTPILDPIQDRGVFVPLQFMIPDDARTVKDTNGHDYDHPRSDVTLEILDSNKQLIERLLTNAHLYKGGPHIWDWYRADWPKSIYYMHVIIGGKEQIVPIQAE